LLMKYAGEVLFRSLPIKVIIQLLTALLLEYKVILVSSHPMLLTASVLALVPLCRPYEVAASVIPMMPKSLLPFIDAPIPLLVGLTSPPPAESLNAMDSFFCTVNLHTAQLTTTKPLPAMPDQANLIRTVEEFMKSAGIPAPSSRGLGMEVPEKIFTPTMSDPQRSFLSAMFQGHFSEFVQDFERHCISDVGSSKTTTVFIKESFVMTKDESQHDFLNAFLDTQMFKVYEDKKLRDLDREKTEHRNSLRNGRVRSATTRPAGERRPGRVVGGRPQRVSAVAAPAPSAETSDASASDDISPAPSSPAPPSPAPSSPDPTPAEDKSSSKDDESEKESRVRRHHHHHHKDKEQKEDK